MNIKHIQFNHQWTAASLFAGLTLALAAGLAWIAAEASGSAFQPARMVKVGAYSSHLDSIVLSAAGGDSPEADLGKNESGAQLRSYLKSVKGGKGGANGGDVHK